MEWTRRTWMTAIPGVLASVGVASAGSAALLCPRRASAAFGVRGTFAYSGGRAQEQRRAAAVEDVVQEVNVIIRRMARERILKGTAPKSPLEIELDPSARVASLRAPTMPLLRGSTDGRPVAWKTADGDRNTVNITQRGEVLSLRFRGNGGDSRYVYRFAPDGQSLLLQASVTHRLMPKSLRFRLSYRKVA